MNKNRFIRLSLAVIILAGGALQARAEGPAPASMLIPKVTPTVPATAPQRYPVAGPTTQRPTHLGHIVHSQNLSKTDADTKAASTAHPQPIESKVNVNSHIAVWNEPAQAAEVIPMSMMVVPTATELARPRASYNNPFVH